MGRGNGDLGALLPVAPGASASSSAVLLRFDRPVWEDPQVLTAAKQGLDATGDFRSVLGALDPNGTVLTPGELTQLHERLGSPGALPAVAPAGALVSAQVYNAYRNVARFVSADGRTVQYLVVLRNNDSSSSAALAAVPGIRADVARVAASAGATQNGLFGLIAFAHDVSTLSQDDLLRVIPIVGVLIAALLAVVMRSLVAPLYLVASVVVSYLAALGVTAIVFVHIGGQLGLQFVLPFLMFVFLMALGSDYNILVMTRIREEAHAMPLRDAVRVAVARTGTTVTTAGVILGGTFAVLALAAGSAPGSDQIRQIGYGITAGILMDTFVVRTVLVPAIVVVLGRWNWWPSRLWHEPGAAQAAGPVETAA